MKRILSYLKLCMCLIIGVGFMMQPVYAFDDLNDNSDSTAYIQEFYERGLIKGYPDGTFRPMANISRAEFLTLINRTFGYIEREKTESFKDILGNEWYIGDLKIAIKQGYIKGYPDKTFRPTRSITRQEVAVVLNQLLGYTLSQYVQLDDEVAIWARDAVHSLLNNGIMFAEKGQFNGNIPITREDTVLSLLTILHQKEQKLEDPNNPVVPTSPTSPTGIGNVQNDDIPTPAVITALQVTSSGLQSVLNGETSYARKLQSAQLQIVSDVKAAMLFYLADYSYDYEGAANTVNVRYNLLSNTEKDDVENAISASVPYIYLNTLDEFFHNN